ncbi:protein SIEVE ELEMENT OCCLUSION B-like [Rhodamnia argentea]|uniref:Protein SIEVE ELEMENT OCCLUSION B-like n=1 Tax=Rhodamnia argentea TaxID=178133 RepID=A0A8B8Q265_9MYRT|nr:protein SIEVE ELEMENT OCCLUSION B-like [Rhodamnia argentea]
MAGRLISAVLGGSQQRTKQPDQGLLNSLLPVFDDDKFMKQMVDTHAPDEGDVDVQALFALVENTLKGSTAIVDNVVNPNKASSAPASTPEFKPAKEGFTPPLSTISEVTCQITCKALDNKNVRETMSVIFHELSSYSLVAKAVVTLSSLALYYGDFWRLARIEPSDKLAQSMAVLKGLPAITKPLEPQKIQVFGVLNDLIKTTLEMTQCIVEFDHDSKDVPELAKVIDITSTVYQIIITVLGCSIQFTALITTIPADESKGRDLPAFARKVNMIHHSIKRQLEEFKLKKEEIREYQRLQRLFNAPTDNVELIKALFYTKDGPQPLYRGSKKTTDKIECLRRKNVLLLISDLKLSSHDLSILVKIYNEPKFQESHEILWIPVMDQEGEDLPNIFEKLQSQMPWCSMHHPTLVNKVAIKIIKEKWHFRNEPIVVVLDPQGKVESQNAMSMIRMWGFNAFPFTDGVVTTLWRSREISWFELLVNDSIAPGVQAAIKSEKLIFLYGGEDTKGVAEVEVYLKKIIEDGNSIVACNVGKIQLFWTRLESCMFSMLQGKADILDPLLQDVLKLYTNFKKDGGFALLTKGTRVVINTPLASASKVLVQYDTWKKQVNVDGKTFDVVLKEHHDKVVAPQTCHHFYIPNMVGYVPENVKCPVCPRVMKNIVKFECCHGAH